MFLRNILSYFVAFSQNSSTFIYRVFMEKSSCIDWIIKSTALRLNPCRAKKNLVDRKLLLKNVSVFFILDIFTAFFQFIQDFLLLLSSFRRRLLLFSALIPKQIRHLMAKHLEEALLERFSPISSLRIFQPALAKNFGILNYFSAS